MEICKKWKPQRNWLVAMNLPYHDLPEELLYQKLMKKYKFDQRKQILVEKYNEFLKLKKSQAEERKKAIKEVVEQQLVYYKKK